MIARTVLLVLFLTGSVFAADRPAVKLVSKNGKIEISIGGKPASTYNVNANGKLPKPYMWPVRGPGGTNLARPIARKGDDHPHHKGIWVAIDEVNGVRFWAEKWKRDGKVVHCKIVTRKIATSHDAKHGTATIHVVNAWNGPDGGTEVVEDTNITIHPNGVYSYDITFKAEKKPAEFHDTKEGLFGFRMVNAMREREGGKVVNSKGHKGTKACWVKPADWIDYSGEVHGQTFGVAIFDHPKNFRKSRYHVRNYGLFSINPFGEKAYARNPVKPTVIPRGKSLRLRYAIYVHAGNTNSAKVASVYKRWVKNAGR